MLKVEVETLSPIRRRLRVEVPQEQVVAELERAYSGLSRRARIPGFRPGRAPRHVLERQFGEHVRGEVFGKLIQESLSEAVEKEEIAVVGPPQIETEQAQPGRALRYSATVEIYPELDVHGYQGLELQRTVVSLEEADVDRYLGELRESLAQLRPIEGRDIVQRGDVARIDYRGEVDGKVVTQGEDRPCEVGKGTFPAGFEDRLVGARVGEAIDFDQTFDEEHGTRAIAGKTVRFHVSVRSLAEKEVPELDDDFAKDHGECDTLEQLRASVRARLEEAVVRRADDGVRVSALGKVVEAQGEIEVPAALVERRLRDLMAEVMEEWKARRIWPKDESAALESLRKDLVPRANGEVRVSLVLDAIARKEQIEATDDDVDAEIERLAAGAGEAGERVRALYASADARANLQTRLRRHRVVEWVLQRAQVRDVAPPPSSVIAGPEESR